MTDGELLQHYAAKGDGGAFAEIVRRHGGMVHATAKRLARDDADDVTQAVFLLLAQKAGTLARYRNLAGWLYNVTRYCAANARRTRGRRQRHLERYQREAAMTHPAASPAEPDPAVAELLDAALAKLKDDQRQAVLLRYIEGLSLEESAARIGINAAAVAKRAERGLARLREYFAARGVMLSDAALAATPVTPALLASLSQVGAGGTAAADGAAATTLASSTAKSMAAIASVKAAAVVLAAAAAVTVVAVAADSSFRTPRPARAAAPATSTAVAAPVLVPPTPAPTTRPPLTADGGKAVAEALLRAIRERDEDRIAALCAAPTERERRDFAAGLIAEALDRAYARFPQRLDGVANWMMTSNPNGQATSMELEAPTPTLAQVRRLEIELRPVGGTWRVSNARMSQVGVVQGEQFPKPPASQPTTATSAPAEVYAQAAELLAKPRVTFADMQAGVTEVERPIVLPMLRDMQDDMRQVAELLRATEFAAFEADVRTYSDRLEQLRVATEQGGVTAFNARGKELLNDAALNAAVGRLSEVQEKLKERLAAAAPAASRPTQPKVPPGSYANATEIFQAFQARVMFDPEQLTDADAPRLAESLKLAQADVRRLVDVLRPTDLALDDETVRNINLYLESAGERLAKQGVQALKSHEEGALRDRAMAEAAERFFQIGRTLTARADAEAEAAQPTGPRPSAFASPVKVTQAWDGQTVRLPGPVIVPPWFRASRTFQLWQKRHNVETFRTRDDAGNRYEIHCMGAVRERDGKSYDVIPWVRMYRPDGTLAATSEWDHYGQATSWATLDETGERYTMQVTTTTRGDDRRGPREIMTVSFFDADENQREWNMAEGNVVWLETLNNPIGTSIRVLNQAPRKTTTTPTTTTSTTRGR